MHPTRSRRANPLFRAAAIALLALASGLAMGQALPPPAVEPVAPGVWWLAGRFERGSQPDGNSLLLQGDGGLVLVDSGRHATHTQALLDFARERGQPIVAVVNTHWHLDHLAGNALLRAAHPGVKAYAAPAVRDAIRQRMPRSEAEYRQMLQQPGLDEPTRRMVEIDLAIYGRRAALEPDVLLDVAPQRLALAGRDLEWGVARGVSGGDAWVLDRRSGTLAVGDFITLPVPFLDTACPAQWLESFKRLDALPFERILPGHGPWMSRADFSRYRRAFERLLDCAATPAEAAQCSAGWVADLGPLLPGSSERSSHAMLKYYIAERLRAAPERTAEDCR